VLLLDEVHVLPLQVQRSLLRFAEDGIFSRIGETQSRHIELTMICCTNLNLHKPESRSRMAHDLASRLHHVEIPPLDQRRADVAEIFAHHLENAATQVGLATDALKSFLTASHLEAISLLCFTERNVRELIHLAEAVAAQVRLTDGNPAEILSRILAERYPDNPVVRRSHGQLGKAMNHPVVPRRGVSHYEQHRTLIVELFKQNGGNLSATVRALKSKGIKTSRRWLNLYLQKWGQR
jgi:DNA-binding NtrC family response regulator